MMDEIICKIAETAAEREGHFAARRAAFVEEQGLFEASDVDEHDAYAIHLVAVNLSGGAVVGAVRCYPAGGDVWYGGRLAVLPAYRRQASSIGANLCRLAEATVLAHGCRLFLAYIQMQNVRFFERLGWRAYGDVAIHYGVPHLLMAASLARPVQAAERLEIRVRQVAHV
ncbi:MAG TPA: MSMEG_0567/Sll0786 family nitrogen starvation N-acetyltransferase [Roseiflexaceae bacterium]